MLVEVALPLPMPRTFTYRAPTRLRPGTRVLVPFANRRLVGWVAAASGDGVDAARVRDVARVLDDEPSVPAELMKLCAWVADYYVASLGQVLRAALPLPLSSPKREDPPVRTQRILRIRNDLPSLLQRDETFGRARRQRDCYEALEAMGGSAESAHLANALGFSHAVQRALVERGVAEFAEVTVERDPFADLPATPAKFRPSPAQRQAIDALLTAADGRAREPFLLHGVTGSGKTLVYIELLRDVVERRGRGAIVLVPEIALTPQTVARFRGVFGDKVAVLHSALSEGERYDAWRALRSGERRIAVGARSAIFAPVRDLGAIVVDEEHETTYKQSDSEPRYHAREVAIVRAAEAGAVCVLGSATPSLETWQNASLGKYRLLSLPARVSGYGMPAIRLVDLRKAAQARARPILSEELVGAIGDRIGRGEQTILLLNRRGYSSFVQCASCGNVWQCPNCNVSLTYHRGRRRVVCHYCFREEAPPVTCDACGSADLVFRGVGTEQVERAVAEAFPAARVARMDVDTTSGKWAHHRILSRVENREVDILLGTQMIAKGLDFPNVTLVGVISADVGLNLPDFRAAERTFQLLTQVAGRAGRGPGGGEVIVQTSLPGNYAIQAALAHDYAGFAERELAERAGPVYPPHCRLVNVVVSGLAEAAVQEAIDSVAEWLRGQPEARSAAITVTGPAPCPIDRIRGRWRWHLLLRARSHRVLGDVCRRLHVDFTWRPGPAELRLAIDRDPVALL